MSANLEQNIVLFNKPFCKFGSQCSTFIRFVNSNDYSTDDMDHCSKEFHPGRRCGMTIRENFQLNKFKTAYQHCIKLRAHQQNRNFWGGKVNNGDLSKEVEKNGFAEVLTSKLYKRLQENLTHERHIQIGSPLSSEQMLAVMLYTDTTLYSELKQDEIEFSMQDVTADTEWVRQQRWPVFGRILNSAICCLNKYDRDNRPAIVYHGLHGIEVDPTEFNNSGYENRPKNNPFFKYGSFISTSQHKEVAFSFMGCDDRVADHIIGSMFEIDTHRDEDGNEIIGADISWISKFPDEGEFLIARLVQLGINDLQFHPKKKFYLVKASVEFFAHRGQMCFSLKHDMSECNCDFQAGRRPSWIPLPENVSYKNA
jgi:hypothetical protein